MTNEQRIERKNQTIIIRRNHSALRNAKVNVSINRADNDESFNRKLVLCKNQAQVIHLCVENKKALSLISSLLVEIKLCKSESDAVKRIKRHINNDKASRIVSRSLFINS